MPASHRYTPAIASPPVELHLASWPLRDEGASGWALLLGSAALATLAGYLSESLPLGLLSFAALFAALWRLWMPMRYSLGPRGVGETVLGRTRRITWTQIARYEPRRRGVLLLATHEPTPLRTLQARYIPWGRHRAEVLEMVRYYLDR